jgi:hypothetical protein
MRKPRQIVGRKHKRVVGQYLHAKQQTVDLEKQVAARARVLEKQLMADGARLKAAMRPAVEPFKLRRLEVAYLKVMHRLAAVRRAYRMAVETVARES